MRQVLVKEWRQGHLIALFGLLMGGLITALWGILTVAWVKNWMDQETVNGFCGVMYYLVPLLLAVFVGSGLFAAEVERGTLPLLLALPFTRRQMWSGKVVAGVALTMSAVALVIVPGVIAVRPALEEVGFWQYLPDLALTSALLFCASLFWSTVCGTIVSAFLSTIATVAGLVVVAILLLVLGGRLAGPRLLDVELWALAAIPGLLVGSYVGFARGETLMGRRRWARPLTAAALVYVLTALPLIGLARWATRYDRSQVEKASGSQITGGGSAVSTFTYASPVYLEREVEVRLNDGPDAGHRKLYAVSLDVNTGKELLVEREAGLPQVSPDGKFAFQFVGPRPLTWRGDVSLASGAVLQTWDLERHRMIYRGLPSRLNGSVSWRTEQAEWTPDSRLIGLTAVDGSANEARIVLVRPDGTVARQIELPGGRRFEGARAHVLSGDSLYVVDGKGSVTRHALASGKAKKIWEASTACLDADGWLTSDAQVAVSPDGERVAIGVGAFRRHDRRALPPYYGMPGGARFEQASVLAVVRADGSGAPVVLRRGETRISQRVLVWSPDGGTLYHAAWVERPRGRPAYEVTVWRMGEPSPSLVMLPVREGWLHTAVLPDGRFLIMEPRKTWFINPRGKAERAGGNVAAALSRSTPAGLDGRGRMIVERREEGDSSYLAALDLKTGQVSRIYP